MGKDRRDPVPFVFLLTLPFRIDSFSSSVDISKQSFPAAFRIREGNDVVDIPTFPFNL